MLNPEGNISFVEELLALVEAFIAEYEAARGPLDDRLEQSLVMAYAMGVMRCDIEALWQAFSEAPSFGSLRPQLLFKRCAQVNEEGQSARLADTKQRLADKGWLG